MFEKIITTSNSKTDDNLVGYLESKDIDYFRGSEKNVLSRYTQLYEKFKPENITRLTGDNPLIDSEVIKEVVSQHLKNNSDYSSNIIKRSWPRGNDVECINGKVLYQLLDCTLAEEDYEHVTLYIRKNLNFYNYVSLCQKNHLNIKI